MKPTINNLTSSQQREFLKAHFSPFVSDQKKGRSGGPVETPPPAQAERIALPPAKTLTCGQMPVCQAIGRRRSRRKFSKMPLTQEQLAYLCWATLGIQKVFGHGQAVYRTVPSAGARHALQLYLAAGNVDGLAKGLYRYMAVDHELVQLRNDDAMPDNVAKACFDQNWMAGAGAVLILTALPYRMEWRYGPAAAKLIALDAGHAGQNAYLAAESIGAGACAVAAYDQQQADRLLDVDGHDEFVIYLIPVGNV